MPAPLAPCSSCRRHVRATEAACPFCGAALGEDHRRAARRPSPAGRLSRAAMFAFGSAVATSASGCYDSHLRGVPLPGPELPDAGFRAEDSGGGALLYGTPPDPEPLDAGLAIDAGIDAGEVVVPAYGGPVPIDPVDAGPPDDAGGAVNLYGAPPAPGGGSGAGSPSE